MLIRWWYLTYVTVEGATHLNTVVHPQDVERVKSAIRDGEPVTWSIDPDVGDVQFLDCGKLVSASFAPMTGFDDLEKKLKTTFGDVPGGVVR